jgi:hypothetical protein
LPRDTAIYCLQTRHDQWHKGRRDHPKQMS